MRVSFIGSGNTATQLALALYKKGIRVSQVISASIENATILAQKVNAQAGDKLSGFNAEKTDILLLATTDDKTPKIGAEITDQNRVIVAHTSGSVNMDVLELHKKHGVFYPFLSMQKNIEANFSHTPFLIEGNDEQTVSALKNLAEILSDNIVPANSQQRQMLHLAAIFANNFVNNQLAIAEDILAKNNLSFDLLRPLLADYFAKLQHRLPHELQTGPAVRDDKATIEHHLNILHSFPDYQNIYRLLTNSIQRKAE